MLLNIRRHIASIPFKSLKETNNNLLETFSQIIGSCSKTSNSLAKGTIDSKTVKSHIDHSMLTAAEPVKEFNTSPSDRTNYSGNLRMFQVGELYSENDLVKLKSDIDLKRGALETKNYVDIFRRKRLPILHTHKNITLLSSMLSPTGKIMSRKTTTYSAKTQRQLSKVIRRARQIGMIPYMQKPKVE